MIDNLQVFYLRKLESAYEYALHGNIEACIEICLDLRLKATLALYTRAMVNLTLAIFTKVDSYPTKGDFAQEALRLIIELKEDDEPEKDAVWITEYDRVEKQARDLIETIEREELEFRNNPERSETQLKTEHGVFSFHNIEEQSAGRYTVVEVPPIKDEGDRASVEPWKIEGAFTEKWVHAIADDSSSMSFDDDRLATLPVIEKKMKDTTLSQLPTPTPSRTSSAQPDSKPQQ